MQRQNLAASCFRRLCFQDEAGVDFPKAVFGNNGKGLFVDPLDSAANGTALGALNKYSRNHAPLGLTFTHKSSLPKNLLARRGTAIPSKCSACLDHRRPYVQEILQDEQQ